MGAPYEVGEAAEPSQVVMGVGVVGKWSGVSMEKTSALRGS